MKKYTPRTILITGATGDFGKAFVDAFKKTGCKFILWGRSEEKLRHAFGNNDSDTHFITCDLLDENAIEKAWATIPEDFRDIDVVINNAGGAFGYESAEATSWKDWSQMIDINVKSLTKITHLALPEMVSKGDGHIINIGSTAGNYPYPGGHVYCAVKAFVKQFSLALRADLFNKSVRVTNIEPGMTETQFSRVRYKGDENQADSVYADTSPMQAQDVAEAVYWVATMPKHVNINRIEMMPTTQGPGPLQVHRFSEKSA